MKKNLRIVAYANEVTIADSWALFSSSYHPGPEHDGRLKEGWFHKWIEHGKLQHDSRESNIWALIENDQGLMDIAFYTCVKFLD